MGFTIKTTTTQKDIVSVNFNNARSSKSVSMSGGYKPLVVRGRSGAKYKLKIEKKTSLTSDVTHASGYYSFTTRSFSTIPTDGSREEIGTISNGFHTHFIRFPEVTDDTRYDVIIDPVVDGVIASIEDGVPTSPGEFKITQYGVRVFTLAPTRYTTANFGAMPSNLVVTRPKRYAGDSYGNKSMKPIFSIGGTGGASSTRLFLKTPVDDLRPNMIVTCPSMPAGVTIKSIQGRIITLSSACTIADNTNLRFDLNNGRLVPFSFTITPNANTINNTAGVDLRTTIGGLRSRVRLKTAQTHSGTKTIVVDDTRGLLNGMIVQDIGTTYEATGFNRIAGVTNFTTFTVSEDLTTADDVEFDVIDWDANSDIRIIHMHSDDSTVNVVITGYLDIIDIKTTRTHPLYIEDIITVS